MKLFWVCSRKALRNCLLFLALNPASKYGFLSKLFASCRCTLVQRTHLNFSFIYFLIRFIVTVLAATIRMNAIIARTAGLRFVKLVGGCIQILS